ncbi:MAG: signal recognition particle [Candidatus Thermoplasmatota archaeon]|nr:signal recognition particle [Candidatus Thermoplasmatota archaeon]
MTVTLFTQYFLPGISKKYGRRINKKAAQNFSLDRLKEILGDLKVKYEIKEGRYPRVPWENSKMIIVETNLKKSTLLKIIERRFS